MRTLRSVAVVALALAGLAPSGLGLPSAAAQTAAPAAPPYAVQQAGGPFTSSVNAAEGAQTTYTSTTPDVSSPQPAPGVQRLTPVSSPASKPSSKLAPPGGDSDAKSRSAGSGMLGVVGSLVVVLGLFLIAAWIMRRSLPQQNRTLPKEAVETLGRIPFPARQQGQLLRVGNKLVLVSFSAAGAHVITEVTDPLEVDRLAGLCAQNDPHGATRSFRDVVDGFFRERPGRETFAAAGRPAPRAEEDDVA